MRNLKNALLFIVVLPLLYSCTPVWIGVGAGMGIGAYKYVEGNLERDYPFTYDKAWDITNQTLTNMKTGITHSMKDEGIIDGIREDGKTVKVSLLRKSQWVTTIRVRVGFWGDREASARIHDEIARIAGL